MRLNVRTGDTGVEEKDWDHIDNVTEVNVDVKDDRIDYQQPYGEGGSYDLDEVEFFHVTVV